MLRYLTDTKSITPTRISAAGYADQRPIAPNDTDAGRAENRRVEVVVLSQLDSDNKPKEA